MKNQILSKYLQETFEKAGITLNGDKPYDINIRDEQAIKRILNEGSLGLGESYMEGQWECEQLDMLSYHLCQASLDKEEKPGFLNILLSLPFILLNPQSKRRSKEVALKHYDLDNQLFECMLDESMAYSCGYWRKASDLSAAQIAKYELISKKLAINSQDTVLDIGCGWGGLAAFMAEKYGCHVTAISISKNQIAYAKERYFSLPIDFCLADYRDTSLYNPTQKPFSKIVSVGAFEHIGYKNYDLFLQLARQQLNSQGLFLLHTIGNNESLTSTDRFISKYIFPNSNLPSLAQLTGASEGKFIMEDWHNFGADYDPTLMAWHANFERHWPILEARFDARFYRMWRYYLLMCAGMFRARAAQLWQIVFSPSGVTGGYKRLS